MAQTGDVIESPATSERIIFRQTAQDTHGALLQFDDILQVAGIGPPEHIHPHQEERFQVVAGTMGVRVDGREQTLHVGENLIVPAGAAHTWWNAGNDELHQITEFRPALKLETFFETLFGLARDGKGDKVGQPKFLQIAVMVPEYDIYLSKPPIPMQKALFAVLGPIARLLGYQSSYQQYSSSKVNLARRATSTNI
jgi:mannose-6-phosphate isomerase-like protein (cupin superfamily)